MTEITLSQLQQAINHWRIAYPSRGEECALSVEVNALAGVYALMIFGHLRSVAIDTVEPSARQLILGWLQQSVSV